MTSWQQIAVIIYGILNLWVFAKSFYEIKNRKNTFGLAGHFGFLGIFVRGDAVILGSFWVIVSCTILLLQDWYLFLLTLSLFWVVRSAGEVIYWLNEQFAAKFRNPPQTLKFYKFFNGESVWFIYQLFWQCVLVVSLIASIYLAALWLYSRF